jgi:hypothetical protein
MSKLIDIENEMADAFEAAMKAPLPAPKPKSTTPSRWTRLVNWFRVRSKRTA